MTPTVKKKLSSVLFILTANEHILTQSWLQIVEVAIISVGMSVHTVSWRIRIFNCIEEVPRFFFAIEFNSTFQISNYLQFNCTPDTI
jgi:hypothetical protein